MQLRVKDYEKLQRDFGFKKISAYDEIYESKSETVEHTRVSLLVKDDLLKVYVSNDYVWVKLKDYEFYNSQIEENEMYYKQDQVDLLCNCDILIPDDIVELLLEMLEQDVIERVSE